MPPLSEAPDDAHRTILHAGPAPAPRPEQRLRDAETSGTRRPPPSPSQSSDASRFVVASADAIAPGAVLAGTRYRIIGKLGDGGMGTVYEAEHIDIERRVALKILRPELTRSPEIVEQFRAEARSASKVGSEHIAQVFDFAELPDGSVMFTMELVNGPTLREELRTGPISSARAIALLRQICKGLDAAHKAGVVHRDVKPDNIVIEQRRGRADAVKLLDFGIAAILGEERSMVAAGTPHYCAPEIVAGTTFDRRADIYAVGCTAYEMLVGKPPFGHIGAATGTDVEEVLGSHLADVAEPPSRARRDLGISPALDNVIMRCLAKLPSNRFRNMGELEAALCAAQIDASLQTSWDDLPLPDEVDPVLRERLLREMPDLHTQPTERRRGGWIVPVVAVLAIAAGGFGAYVWATRREPAAPTQNAGPTAVDKLVNDARAAAARSAFVYPAVDDADQSTAYAKVRELEELGDPAATDAAKTLRTELTDTLVRLGDSFWDREGGRTFAVEYYRQALLFDRSHAHARERAELGTEALDDLERKAENIEFSPQEIAAAQPMRRASHAERAGAPRVAGDPLAPIVPPSSDAEEVPAGEPLPPKPTQVGHDEQAGAADLVKGAAQLLAAGHRADAEEMYKRALTYDPNNVAALQAMCGIAAKRGDHDDALEYAERIVANAPQRATGHLLAGDAAYALDQIDDARRSWSRAAALGSKPAETKLAKLDAAHPPPAKAPAAPAETPPADAAEDDEEETPKDKPSPAQPSDDAKVPASPSE
jgi:serine/threonine protein kinase/tetratricopeptide (TPR) repeat protein